MGRTLPKNLAQGQAGVYRVASELLLRGFPVNLPAVDCGADLTTEAGVRIQVKSTHLSTRRLGKSEVTAYYLKLTTRAIVRKHHIRYVARKFSEECDFVVLWGIEQNRFWVVPSMILDGHSMVMIGLDEKWVKVDIDAAREAREQGLSYQEIAEKFKTNHKTIWRRLNLSSTPKGQWGSLCQAVRETESRWDLISSYLSTLEEESEDDNVEVSLPAHQLPVDAGN